MLEICPFFSKIFRQVSLQIINRKIPLYQRFSNLLQNLIKFLIFLSRQQLKKSI